MRSRNSGGVHGIPQKPQTCSPCCRTGDVPKGGATSPVPEQRPDRKACSLNTVYHRPPPEPTDSFTVFSDWGRAERRRHHPVPMEQMPEGKAYSSQVLAVMNPMNVASRLIDGNAHGYAVGIYKSHEISWYYRGRRTTYLGLISLSGCQPPRHIATRLIDGNVRIQKRLAQVRSSIKLVKCPVTCHAGSRGVMSRSQFTWDFPSPNSAVGLLPPISPALPRSPPSLMGDLHGLLSSEAKN